MPSTAQWHFPSWRPYIRRAAAERCFRGGQSTSTPAGFSCLDARGRAAFLPTGRDVPVTVVRSSVSEWEAAAAEEAGSLLKTASRAALRVKALVDGENNVDRVLPPQRGRWNVGRHRPQGNPFGARWRELRGGSDPGVGPFDFARTWLSSPRTISLFKNFARKSTKYLTFGAMWRLAG